jgi:hypothetical protein
MSFRGLHLILFAPCFLSSPWSSAALLLFSGPVQIRLDCLVFHNFIEGIKFPAKKFFRELFMDKGMAVSANIDASPLHVRFIKVLFEPFITMTTSGNKMMEGDGSFATA